MKTFLFYTKEGFTESPNNVCVDNCQLLGEATGETMEAAFADLLNENPWIEKNGFHTNSGLIIARELAHTKCFYI